jgi:hypothetical protein
MMNAKAVAVVIVALASTSVLAQSSHQRAVMFGNEVVALKFNNIPASLERDRIGDAIDEAADPVEKERLWRIRWEDYGDTVALQALANYHLERGDLVQAYAHLYAVDKIAKWYESVMPEKPGPILTSVHNKIAADVELIAKQLTASQRELGIKFAAALIRNNPNCCTAI